MATKNFEQLQQTIDDQYVEDALREAEAHGGDFINFDFITEPIIADVLRGDPGADGRLADWLSALRWYLHLSDAPDESRMRTPKKEVLRYLTVLQEFFMDQHAHSQDEFEGSIRWHIAKKSRPKEGTVARKAVDWLAGRSPCTVVRLEDAYSLDDNHAAIRAAVYAHTANNPVSAEKGTETVYGIRVAEGNEDIIVTLPGISIAWIALDNDKDYVPSAKGEVEERVGTQVRRWLLDSLQRRSVDYIAKVAKQSKEATGGTCRMCVALGLTGEDTKHVTACHIVSRRTVFWSAVLSVLRADINLLTNQGMSLLEKALLEHPYHSDSEYILPLCNKHDKALQQALRDAASQQPAAVNYADCGFTIAKVARIEA